MLKPESNLLDNQFKECKYCYARVTRRSIRCSACGSLIGHKRNIPDSKRSENDSNVLSFSKVIPFDNRCYDRDKTDNNYNLNDCVQQEAALQGNSDIKGNEEDCAMSVQNISKNTFRTSYFIIFLAALFAFIPIVGQVAGFFISIIFIFTKDHDRKNIGKSFLFNALFFFVLWVIIIYYINKILDLQLFGLQ